jgi:hypothetical protein
VFAGQSRLSLQVYLHISVYIPFATLLLKMATSSWDPDSGTLHIVYATSQNSNQCIFATHTIALLKGPKFHELDLISGNYKTVRVFEGTASKWDSVATRLYFDGNTISQIWTDSQHNQLRACRNVFNEWLSGKEGLRTPRKWSTVIEVLKEAHLGQLADELRDILGGAYTIQQCS